MVCQAALWVELTARLGVHWGPVDRHGPVDIDGVPAELATLFSKRTAQVEPRAAELIADAEAELGRWLTAKGRRRFYEVGVLETRTAKDQPARTTVHCSTGGAPKPSPPGSTLTAGSPRSSTGVASTR